MTKAEKKLASRLMLLASDAFSNHSCNDMPEVMFAGITEDELMDLEHAFNEWNSSEAGTDKYCPWQHIGGSSWMGFLAARLYP